MLKISQFFLVFFKYSIILTLRDLSYSFGIDFRRKNDVYKRQILTSKVGPCTNRVKVDYINKNVLKQNDLKEPFVLRVLSIEIMAPTSVVDASGS